MSVASNFSDKMEFAISDKRFYRHELRFDTYQYYLSIIMAFWL